MSERNMGQVVPFQVNAARLRRSAQEHHRRGQPVEAVELLRHAAVKENSAAGWLHLVEQLRRLGCYEQACKLLYRLLAREDAPIRAWLELGYAQHALGKTVAAQDSVFHYLDEDPYSDVADEARALLDEITADDDSQQLQRLTLLVRRGLSAWRENQEQLGERRMRRAIRLAEHPERIRCQLAALLVKQGHIQEGLDCLWAARREAPEDVRTVCILSMALDSVGKRRMALGLLQTVASFCTSAAEEEMLLTAVRSQQAWKTYEAFLMERHRQQPCSIRLLHHMAQLQWHKGQKAMAEGYLRRILRLDPDDICAISLLQWMGEHAVGEAMQQESIVTENTVEGLKRLFAQAVKEGLTPAEMLEPSTESRRAVDWCFEMNSLEIQQLCLKMLLLQDTPGVRLYLRELLTNPTAHQKVKHDALLRLSQLGEGSKLKVLIGQRMTEMECRPVTDGTKHLWRTFLLSLLTETRRHRQAADVANLAAKIWTGLSREQRQQSAGKDCYIWVKAMELYFLRTTGQDKAACQVEHSMPVSTYRVNRVLRQISRVTGLKIKTEGSRHEKVH